MIRPTLDQIIRAEYAAIENGCDWDKLSPEAQYAWIKYIVRKDESQ